MCIWEYWHSTDFQQNHYPGIYVYLGVLEQHRPSTKPLSRYLCVSGSTGTAQTFNKTIIQVSMCIREYWNSTDLQQNHYPGIYVYLGVLEQHRPSTKPLSRYLCVSGSTGTAQTFNKTIIQVSMCIREYWNSTDLQQNHYPGIYVY